MSLTEIEDPMPVEPGSGGLREDESQHEGAAMNREMLAEAKEHLLRRMDELALVKEWSA